MESILNLLRVLFMKIISEIFIGNKYISHLHLSLTMKKLESQHWLSELTIKSMLTKFYDIISSSEANVDYKLPSSL